MLNPAVLYHTAGVVQGLSDMMMVVMVMVMVVVMVMVMVVVMVMVMVMVMVSGWCCAGSE